MLGKKYMAAFKEGQGISGQKRKGVKAVKLRLCFRKQNM